MQKLDFKKIIPYITALVLFLVISYAYFSPVLDGKRLQQHDYMTYKGGAQELIDYREETGKEALWTNRMFVGMPGYMISTKYKGNLLQNVNNALMFGPRPASQLFLLLLGGFILFISLRINPWLSLAGAVALAFSSYNFIILLAGHNSKVIAIAYMAPVIGGIITTFRGKRLLGAALTGIFLSLQLLAGHPQITYYTLLIIFIFGLSELYFSIREKQFKDLLLSGSYLAVAMIFALLSNYSRIATAMEYDDYSMRSQTELSGGDESQTGGLTFEYATGWSYGKDETFTLLIPGFMGGSSAYELDENSKTFEALAKLDRNFAKNFIKNAPMYRGSQTSTSGPVYLGAIVLFLFVLGLFIVDSKYKWWILGTVVLGILLSWGRNLPGLTEFFMKHIPGYNKFRTVSMTLVIPQITVPLLALLSLNEIIFKEQDSKKLMNALKWSTGMLGGILLLLVLAPSIAGSFSTDNDLRYIDMYSGGNPQVRSALMDSLLPALEADRESMLRMDALRSLLFVLLGAASIYLYKLNKIKLGANTFIAIFALLFLIDLWPVNKRFLDDDNFVSKSKINQPYSATAADQAILQSAGLNERVLNLTVSPFQDASTSYFHQSLGGYHGAKLRRYQDLINTSLMDELSAFISTIQQQNMTLLDSVMVRLNIMNMLNTKYIILNPQSAPFLNSHAMGNAWFVNKLEYAENADEELALLSSSDLHNTAIADKKFSELVNATSFTESASDRIQLVEYEPNRLVYKSSNNAERLAVFSEIYYDKGWQAYIDDEKVEHIRVDYLLRGLLIPAGDHTVVFEFHPKSYYTGEKISYAGSIFLILLLAGAIYVEFRKKEE